MKAQKTLYHIILDRSGSMSSCLESTINGFNEQVTQIRRLEEQFPEQAFTIGLSLFNDRIHHHAFGKAPAEMPLLTGETYRPGGSTALLDAIGSTLLQLETDLKAAQATLPTTLVVVVITDGYENASREFQLNDIRKMISRLEATGLWTFSFLGATLDAVDVAERMSFKRENSMYFDKESMDHDVWVKLGNSMSSYSNRKRHGGRTDILFDENL